MRIVNLIFAALFIFGAIVQFNDPDPLAWVAIYLAAAGACLWSIRHPKNHFPAMAVAIVSVVWAGLLAPKVFGVTGFGEMFESWEMKDMSVEYSREMYGLVFIALWMITLAIRAFRMRVTPAEGE